MPGLRLRGLSTESNRREEARTFLKREGDWNVVKEIKEGIVQEKVWGPNDTYLTVEVQVDSSRFKDGEKVKVTIEKF
jgi:hypothetical protein